MMDGVYNFYPESVGKTLYSFANPLFANMHIDLIAYGVTKNIQVSQYWADL